MANQDVRSIADFQEIIDKRRIITVQEAIAAKSLNPRNISLDILFITNDVIIQNKFLREIEMELVQYFEDGQQEKPKVSGELSVVKELLTRLGADQETLSEGIMVLTKKGNNTLKRLYSQPNDLAKAKEMAKIWTNEKSKKTLVFVTSDVERLFKETKATLPEMHSDEELETADVEKQFEILKDTIKSLQDIQGEILYLSPEQIRTRETPVIDKLFKLGEYLERVIQSLQQKSAGETNELKRQIAAMEHQMQNQKNEKELLLEEWEDQKKSFIEKQAMQEEKLNKLQEQIILDKSNQGTKTIQDDQRKAIAALTEKVKNLETAQELVSQMKQTAMKLDPKREIDEESLTDNQSEHTLGGTSSNVICINDSTGKVNATVPAKYGMRTWNPVTSNIFSHLQSCKIGIAQAQDQKVSESQIMNLVLMTLPAEYQYISDFMEATDKETLDKFLAKIVELIQGSKQEQLSVFLREHRKAGENILGYFSRISALYKHSSGKTDSDLENDKFGVQLIYQKTFEGMTGGQRAELQRLAETKVIAGDMKFSELKKNVAASARKASVATFVNENFQSGTQIQALNDIEDTPKKFRKNTTSKPVPKCYICNKPGHYARNCYSKNKFQRSNGPWRKTSDDSQNKKKINFRRNASAVNAYESEKESEEDAERS